MAIGFANLTHDSLAVSPDGAWLPYVGGANLYVSKGGAKPAQLSSSGVPTGHLGLAFSAICCLIGPIAL